MDPLNLAILYLYTHT